MSNDKDTKKKLTPKEIVETILEIEKAANDSLEKIKNLELHIQQMKGAFEDNIKASFDDGFSQGRSFQAICEIRGRESFQKDIDKFIGSKGLSKDFQKYLETIK